MLEKGKERKKHKNTVGHFLQQLALGVTAWLAEAINDNAANNPPAQEQRRCIRAMEEMIKLCKSHIRVARPQVCTFTTAVSQACC